MWWNRAVFVLALALGLGAAEAALAAAGQPSPWQLGLQEGVTPVKHEMASFHNLLLIIITAITVFVIGLLAYVMVRFRAGKNPVPSRTSHNTLVEVAWTVIPVMILVVIAIPSFKLLYYSDKAVDAELTIKAIGKQWYWTYEYPDYDNFTFDALMVPEEDLKDGQPRLLATDNHVVVPVDTVITVQITAADVLHSWAVPSLGIKRDGNPGKLNETWFKAEREGLYYGQCSELCGTNHAFMPITVEVVSREAFAKWVEEAKQRFARADAPAVSVAAAPAARQ